MSELPYDQRLARRLVRPLARTPVSPNHLTALTLVLALASAGLFATGAQPHVNWAAGLFVLARFIDHFDGELARLKNQTSSVGYYFDYAVGAISYAVLFAGIAIGLAESSLGIWAIALGAAGAGASLLTAGLGLIRDRQLGLSDCSAEGYPALAGFELEDGIYLIAPITWMGWLGPFFVLASTGAAIYCLVLAWRVVRAKKF